MQRSQFTPPFPSFNGHPHNACLNSDGSSIKAPNTGIHTPAASTSLHSTSFSVETPASTPVTPRLSLEQRKAPSSEQQEAISPYPELIPSSWSVSKDSPSTPKTTPKTTASQPISEAGAIDAKSHTEILNSLAGSLISGNTNTSSARRLAEGTLRSLSTDPTIYRFSGIDKEALGLDDEQWKLLVTTIARNPNIRKDTPVLNIFKRNVLQAELEQITNSVDSLLTNENSIGDRNALQDALSGKIHELTQLIVAFDTIDAPESARNAGKQLVLCELKQALSKIDAAADSNKGEARKLSLKTFTSFSRPTELASLAHKLLGASPDELSEAEKAARSQLVHVHQKINGDIDERIQMLETYLKQSLNSVQNTVDSIVKQAKGTIPSKGEKFPSRERHEIETQLAQNTAGDLAAIPNIKGLQSVLNELQLLVQIRDSLNSQATEKEKETSPLSGSVNASQITALQDRLVEIQSTLLNFALTHASKFTRDSVPDELVLNQVLKLFKWVGYKTSSFKADSTTTPRQASRGDSTFGNPTAIAYSSMNIARDTVERATTWFQELSKGGIN